MSQQLFKACFPRRDRTSYDRIFEALDRIGGNQHYVNMYLNGHPLSPTIVVVLNNRDTALLLKLALD